MEFVVVRQRGTMSRDGDRENEGRKRPGWLEFKPNSHGETMHRSPFTALKVAALPRHTWPASTSAAAAPLRNGCRGPCRRKYVSLFVNGRDAYKYQCEREERKNRRKQKKKTSEPRSCVKVEVAVLGSRP